MSLCRPAVQWMLAADAAQRHDQAHLVSHHIQMPLPALATLVSQVPLISVLLVTWLRISKHSLECMKTH